jgi:hypothetical protein
MNRDATFDPFEARLRAVLVEQRPIEGAPARLHARVGAIPDRVGAVGWLARMQALAASQRQLAALVGVLVVVAVAASVRSFIGPVTGGGVSPNALPFDPTVEGPGLVHNLIPTLWVAEALAILLALGLARSWRSRAGFDSWRDMARGLVLIALIAVPAAMAISTPLQDWGGSVGTALGFGYLVNPPPGSDAPGVYYVSAKPGESMIAFFDVTNTSALPVTLEGIVVPDSRSATGPRWTALALAPDRNVYPNEVDRLFAFTPQVIAPNDRVTVYLVGKAGPCAFGPGYTADTVGVTGYASMSRDLQLDYSILGLSATSTFTMPLQLVEPASPSCP